MVFINYSWTYAKDPTVGDEINRNGSFSLPGINVNGITDIDEITNTFIKSEEQNYSL